jgi:adenylate cyclase
MAQWHSAILLCWGRELGAAREHVEELIRVSTEAGPFYQAQGSHYRGLLDTAEGRVGEGISQMSRTHATLAAVGVKAGTAPIYATLAEAHARAGQPEDGLAVLAEAHARVERTGERGFDSELHRLEGELFLLRGEANAEAEAEASFCQAIEVARRQQARSWELRAVTSLARLWQKQGKQEEARERLAEVYGWFTEGFDTPDLRDAKALLEELG